MDSKASKVEENADTGTATLIASASGVEVLGKLGSGSRRNAEGKRQASNSRSAGDPSGSGAGLFHRATVQPDGAEGGRQSGGEGYRPSRGLPLFDPVKIKVRNLPEHVSCTAAEVPAGKAEFRLVFEADESAPPGQFDIELISSTEIRLGKKKRNYTIDPVKTRLIIIILGSATAEASAKAPGEDS